MNELWTNYVLLYYSEGCNICGLVLRECYINDWHTTTCSGMQGHHIYVGYKSPSIINYLNLLLGTYSQPVTLIAYLTRNISRH